MLESERKVSYTSGADHLRCEFELLADEEIDCFRAQFHPGYSNTETEPLINVQAHLNSPVAVFSGF